MMPCLPKPRTCTIPCTPHTVRFAAPLPAAPGHHMSRATSINSLAVNASSEGTGGRQDSCMHACAHACMRARACAWASLDGLPDLRLAALLEADALGVAAALDCAHTGAHRRSVGVCVWGKL